MGLLRSEGNDFKKVRCIQVMASISELMLWLSLSKSRTWVGFADDPPGGEEGGTRILVRILTYSGADNGIGVGDLDMGWMVIILWEEME